MKNIFLSLILAGIPLSAWSQNILNGNIHDEKGRPLSDATIQILDTQSFTLSDELGNFIFNRAGTDTIMLLVRHLGFKPQQLKVDLTKTSKVLVTMKEDVVITDEVVVTATRANPTIPSTYTNVDKRSIQDQNFGQDLPYVLRGLPSVVVTSDAGTGIGYTGIRIRGSDATAINVTLNGIPYNDSESLGTFWVDIPDIAASAQNIQMQRGVGTSTNGAGAFGGTINVQTLSLQEHPYARLINSAGSFNTLKNSIDFGTGLMQKHWAFTGRASRIHSDGFIDRASSNLHAYYFSGGYYGKNTLVRGVVFGGKERTYQSWYGVPESRLNNDYEGMLATASDEGWNDMQRQNLLNSGSRTFNPYTYPDQVDDYQQDHYQLHISQHFSDNLSGNVSLHLTKGKGFYEEYRYNDAFSGYGVAPFSLGDSLIASSDLVRRRWLDNSFYGIVYSLSFNKAKWEVVTGGAWNRYDGDHFGEIIWGNTIPVPPDYRYYFNNGDKRDFNSYTRTTYSLGNKLSTYVDLQFRHVGFKAHGVEDKQTDIDVNTDYDFFNPKFGLVYEPVDGHAAYASFSVGNREPVRDDFIDNPGSAPCHETLRDVEIGYRHAQSTFSVGLNYYFMDYTNQLVLTGAINDVGAAVRTNVPGSYRTGIEGEGWIKSGNYLKWGVNVAFSTNRIKRFTEVLYDYGASFDEFNVVENHYRNTDISFSPNFVGSSAIVFGPFRHTEISLLSKFVGMQYLDNTSNENRKLDPYFVNDLVIGYRLHPHFADEISLRLMINNLFDEQYESNGYSWGYLGGSQEYRENYYFPQAGRNYMLMVTLAF